MIEDMVEVVKCIDGWVKIEVSGNVIFGCLCEIVLVNVDYIFFGVLIYLVGIVDFGLDFWFFELF